ncbi:MAG: hypothetical protein QOE04_3625 [Mycobacterium sp.]|jgi:hypothetical protein|nr:hypothetical protein [Mycobacterium sp.]
MRFCVLISAGHSTSYGTNDASQPSNYTWTTMNAKQSEPKGSTPPRGDRPSVLGTGATPLRAVLIASGKHRTIRADGHSLNVVVCHTR